MRPSAENAQEATEVQGEFAGADDADGQVQPVTLADRVLSDEAEI
jgi:hypothetical protein